MGSVFPEPPGPTGPDESVVDVRSVHEHDTGGPAVVSSHFRFMVIRPPWNGKRGYFVVHKNTA